MAFNQSELESFYKESFLKKDIDFFLNDIASIFVNKYFIEELIDNHLYEKNVFKITMKLISESVRKNFVCNEKIRVQFSRYIFKQHLTDIFYKISDLLLEEIAYSNENVLNFFKYYSNDIVLYKDKRYKVPELEGKDGLIWSIVSMTGILKTYIKAFNQIKKTETDKKDIQNKISALYVDAISPINHNIEVDKEFEILKEKIDKNAKRIEILHDSLEILTKEDDITSAKSELEEVRIQRADLREDKKVLLKKKLNQSVISNYNKLLVKLDNIDRETKAYYKILEQNKKAYYSIKSAVAKALLSKKELIQL